MIPSSTTGTGRTAARINGTKGYNLGNFSIGNEESNPFWSSCTLAFLLGTEILCHRPL